MRVRRAEPADGGRLGSQLTAWHRTIAAHWREAHFGALRAAPPGAERRVTVTVYLGGLAPEAVRVELYADPGPSGEPEHHPMERARALDEAGGGYEYSVAIPAARPLDDYTPRLLPSHPNVSTPLEATEILWQR